MLNRKFWVRLAVTGVLLGLIVTRIDLSNAELANPEQIAIGVVLAVSILIVNQVITAVRWSIILGDSAPGLGYLSRVTMIGIFFSTFLPTSVGGDAVRAWALKSEERTPGLAASSVVIDRVMGLIALVVYLCIGGFLARDMLRAFIDELSVGMPFWTVGIIVAIVVVAILAWYETRLSVWTKQAISHANRFRNAGRSVLLAASLSFVIQGLYITVWIVLSHSVGFTLPLETFLLTVPAVSLGAMIPVTLSGVGIREGMWILLLSNFDLSAATVTAFSLLYFVAFATAGAVGGLMYLRYGLSV